MSPIVLVFCAPGPMRERVHDLGHERMAWAGGLDELAARKVWPGAPIILLGIGADGCAALAKRAVEGLEGVRAVVLVDPVAPWAERPSLLCAKCGRQREWLNSNRRGYGWYCNTPRCPEMGAVEGPAPLGPLEPLRAVAERARKGEACEHCDGVGVEDHHGDCCQCHGSGTAYPLRLVIACQPERAVCAECSGKGWHRGDCHPREVCGVCSGTGNALGSAEAARELTGMYVEPGPRSHRDIESGGVRILCHPTGAALEEHAIGEALRLALEGT